MILPRLYTLMTMIALALSGTIPQGWMPAAGADGKVLLVICTSDGPTERWVDLDGDEPPHDDTDSRMPCPFAGTMDPGLSQPDSFTLTRAQPVQARWDRSEFTHRSAGMHWRYDARGPPALS